MHIRREIRHADDGGDAHGAREDCCVRGAASGFGGERLHVFPVEHGGVRRREVAGDQNTLTGQMVEKLARFSAEVVEHAVGDIRDVRGAFLEILVVDRGNRGDVPLHDSCENHVRRLKLLADAVVDLLHENFVVDDQQVRFKDACLLGSEG